jgi:hypothetical protein
LLGDSSEGSDTDEDIVFGEEMKREREKEKEGEETKKTTRHRRGTQPQEQGRS